MPNNKSDIKSNVKSLYEIMKDEKILEMDVQSKEYSLAIKRKDPNAGVVVERVSVPAQKPAAAVSAKPADKPVPVVNAIKSPITGVFYQAQTPASPAFVQVGDVVDTGKTVCIVEAMKVMNEIKATSKVKILKVLAENGKPVNSGQLLFEIEKA